MNQPSQDSSPASPSRSLGARLGRHLLLLAGVLVVMLLALHGCASVYQEQRMRAALARAEEHWGPLFAPEAESPRADDATNAAVLLRAAAAEHNLDTATLPALNRLKQGRSDMATDRRDLQAIVDSNAASLASLQAALERPDMDWRAAPPPGSHQQAGTAPLTRLLPLASTNWTSGMLAAMDGDAQGAVAAVQRQLLLARAMESQVHLLAQVLRIRVASQALDLIQATLLKTALDEGQLNVLSAGLLDLPGSEALDQAVIAEFKERSLIYLQALAGKDWDGGDEGEDSDDSFDLRATAVERAGRTLQGENPMIPGDVDYLGGAAMRWLLKPLLRRRMSAYLESSDAMLTSLTMPHYQRQASASPAQPGDLQDEDWLTRILPDLRVDQQLLAMRDLFAARLVLARTAVALYRARVASGRYPDGLADLVPSFLDEMPVDPLTGASPGYRLDDDGFVLESERQDFEAEATRNEPWGPTGLLSWSLSR